MKRALLLLGTLIILMIIGGFTTEAILSHIDAQKYPMPGQLVDIGGLKLHLYCQGRGSPTVILDTGLGSPAASWSLVQNEVAKRTRVCIYDRAGYGFSDPGPLPRTSETIAKELHALLTQAQELGPYLLVGHSFGGVNIRMFNHLFPEEVAGLVLVDSPSEESLNSELWMSVWRPLKIESSLALSAARFVVRLGIVRLISPDIFKNTNFSEADKAAIKSGMFSKNTMMAAIDEFQSFVQSLSETRKSTGSLANKPLTVIEAGKIKPNDYYIFFGSEAEAKTMKEEWHSYQKNLAKLSLRSTYLIAHESAHRVPYEQPEIIVSAIEKMIEK